jgi:hypothetical protein
LSVGWQKTESADERHSGSANTIWLPEPIRVSTAVVPKFIRRKVSHARRNRSVKALRVVAMAARQDAKRLDLVSYAIVFVIFAVVAEAIVAALIW